MKFTAELIKKAWTIRRQAAAKFGAKIMSVVWRECLKMARGVAILNLAPIEAEIAYAQEQAATATRPERAARFARAAAKLQRLAAWLANQDAAWANRVFSQDIGTRFDGSMFFNEGAVMYRAQMYGFSA